MKQINVAIAIIYDGARVLICQRRKNDSFGNLWEFPGGKIEPGETPERAVQREIHEELDIEVVPSSSFPAIDHTYPDVVVRLMPFLCAPVGGKTARPLASQRLAWVEPTQLRDYAFPPANTGLIEQIIAQLTIDLAPADP